MRELLFACLTWRTVGQNTGGFFIGPSAEATEGSCLDNRGQNIPEGLLFTPGQDECQVCTCIRKMPVLCRTVLCAPPKNCLSLRVGDACCQWICDEWETPPGTLSDFGLRLVASGITAILSLSLLFFLIYRLRQRRLRSRQNQLQAQSSNSDIGQLDECWVGDTQLASFGSGWRKPFDSTFDRPFPPSYDEAVASTRSPAPAPQYSCPGEPPAAIPYQVATLGRRVFPVGIDSSRTLPSILRRVGRNAPEREPAISQHDNRNINPLFRHSLQLSPQLSEEEERRSTFHTEFDPPQATIDRDARSTSALGRSIDRDARSTSALGSSVDRDARSTSAFGSSVDRDVRSASALGRSIDRDAISTSALGSPKDRDARSTSALGSSQPWVSGTSSPTSGYYISSSSSGLSTSSPTPDTHTRMVLNLEPTCADSAFSATSKVSVNPNHPNSSHGSASTDVPHYDLTVNEPYLSQTAV